jgi:hypothetical protein
MTEVLDNEAWVLRCVAHMLTLDQTLDPDLARPIAEDMCSRARWRDMGPEAAAQAVFDLGNRRGVDGV